MAKKNEIVEVKSDSMVTYEGTYGSVMDMLEQNKGSGLEDITFQDKSTVFLLLLQATSPQVEENDDMKPGMLYNNVNGEAYDIRKSQNKTIDVIPVGFFKEIVEWQDRTSGGGLINRHKLDTPLLQHCFKNDKGLLVHRETGNNFVETANHIVLFRNLNDEWEMGVLAMTSTKLKCSRKWNNLMTSIKIKNFAGEKFNPPMYSHVYELSSVKEDNNKGTYYSFDVKVKSLIADKELLEAAMYAHNEFKKGMIKVSDPLPQVEQTVSCY